MTCLLTYTPAPPDWVLRWDAMDRDYPWLHALMDCPQDPLHHAEGNVWIHTHMVCTELVAMPAWRALPCEDRQVLFAAAVLHDIAKPACLSTDADGRIHARGHSRRGAIQARGLLWRMGVAPRLRERICGLIRTHQLPYFLIEREDRDRLAAEISLTTHGSQLALLATADVRGRICADQQRMLDNIELFREYLLELGVLEGAYPFASDHARVLYFQDPRRGLHAPGHDDTRCEVVLMSGLPGAGKSHHIRSHLADWPMVSLDDLRAELGVEPGGNQGEVLTAARDQARQYLRNGVSFVWNATNVSRQLRGLPLALFLNYHARVRIIHVEAPCAVLFEQNRQRQESVPEAVIGKLLDRWEVPDLTEAHLVESVARPAN